MLCAGVYALTHPKPALIPQSIQQKASFAIFYPLDQNSSVVPQHSSLTYDNVNKALAYTVIVNGKKVTLSEQATPEIFSESGVYNFKLNQAHQYDSFNTSAGEVTLTRPGDLGGQTVAWLNNHGTLILARGLQSLSVAEWQELFNQLSIVRP